MLISFYTLNPAEKRVRLALPHTTRGHARFWRRYAQWALRRLGYGALELSYDDNAPPLTFTGKHAGPSAKLTIHDNTAWRDLLIGGHAAFFKAFLAGKWSTPDLYLLFDLALANKKTWDFLFPVHGVAGMFRKTDLPPFHLMPDDHSATFFSQWLDRSLALSCARFKDAHQSLDDAQTQKYQGICERLVLEPHHKLLEIGPGFGGFALYAARHYGVRVTMLCDSLRQKTYLEHRINHEGFANLIDVQMLHVKDIPQRFDRIVMIEHLERSGVTNWPSFFKAMYDTLLPGGRAEIQCVMRGWAFNQQTRESQNTITLNSARPTRLTDLESLRRDITDAGLLDLGHISFPEDYEQTLKLWQVNFLNNWPQIALLDYDEHFKKLWVLSLNYCLTAFKNGYLNVIQKSVTKPFDAP